MRKVRYTRQSLLKAIQSSKYWYEVIKKIGLRDSTPNYYTLKRYANIWGIDWAHLGHQEGRSSRPNRKPIFTKKKFKRVIKSSLTIREALLRLGYALPNCNYLIYKYAAKWNVDISHFSFGTKRVSIELLANRLSKIREHKCSFCRMPDKWHGRKLPLTVYSIKRDNREIQAKNFRLVCPNCYAVMNQKVVA